MQTLRIALVLVLTSAAVAQVDWRQDAERCRTETNADSAVRSCSSAIDSGRLSGRELAVAYYSRGKAYLGKGSVDKAIADYDRAIALEPDYADAFYGRGQAYSQKRVRQPGRSTDAEGTVHIDLGSGDYPRAIQDFSRVIQLRPDDEQAFRARAIAYRGMGDYERAIEDWGQLIRLRPNDPAAYYARGLACQEKGDSDGAIRDFTQVLRLKPGETDALLYRGDAYLAKGDYDRAIQDFGQVLLSDPESNEGFYGRGEAYLSKGEYDRAIQDFTQAIRVYPENSAAFHDRGNAYLAKGEYDRAIQDFDESIRLVPTYKAFHDRGLAYYSKGEDERAAQDYEQALRLNPRDAEAFSRRGALHSGRGEYSSAIADFSEAIRLNPNDANAFFGRGTARFYLGDFAAAQQDLAQVSSYPYPALWLYLARARAGQEARSGLAKDSAGMNLKTWPAPVMNLFLGKETPQSVLAAAKNADPAKEREQLCEAYFYLGQQALLAGNQEEAKRLFRQTLQTQITRFVEYKGAQAELKRLSEPAKP